MRLELSPLAALGEVCPITGGPEGLHLWHARLVWTCQGTRLDLRVLAPEPLALPAAEPTEPVPGAIARCVRACAGQGALLLLANPAEALGVERIALAEGVRLFAIASEADTACWDALLALGQPCYGVRDRLAVEVLRPRPANLLSALSFGVFYAHDGLEPLSLEESPKHLAWTCAETVHAEVLGKRGFTLAEADGPVGRYDDRGNEGVVRAVLHAGGRSCWTQPRFVAPRKDACHG
ncbi:MAG TPA: hypothetical protein DCS97_10705 [Planctomycetes bacterium]|nr:hypothetical protein [Planctomycetota bacterium]